MTVLHDAQASRCTTRIAEPGRVIAVGIRDPGHDCATMAWAEAEALTGADALHLVHAYVPLRLDGCSWDPVRRERDVRASLGQRITAQAVQRVRAARPGLLVDGSAVQGLPADVLQEFSTVVDLLVIGADAAGNHEHGIARRIQDRARCPVVTVPRDTQPNAALPVTLVVAERGASDAALRFATDAATRHGVPLHMVDGTAQQGDWLTAVSAESSLLVAARGAAPLLRAHPTTPRCPVAIVSAARRV